MTYKIKVPPRTLPVDQAHLVSGLEHWFFGLKDTEKVSVAAGSFSTKHYHSDKYGTDTWVDPAAAFPMVKTVGKSHEMELAATGSGATSSITETPQEMGKP